MYTHFWDEHTMGHHRHLATPLDPVCHETGANLYTGVVKAIIGTHVKGWEREAERLEKLKNGKINWFENLVGNRMHYYFAFNLTLCYSIYNLFGYSGLKWQLIYSSQTMIWLEFVNYLEHYGLRRRQDKNGVYESIGY
jgi:alkane 1-monooxygenase